MPQLNAGQFITCPHCQEGLASEGPVEDFVVQGAHGRTGQPYEND